MHKRGLPIHKRGLLKARGAGMVATIDIKAYKRGLLMQKRGLLRDEGIKGQAYAHVHMRMHTYAHTHAVVHVHALPHI